MNETLKEKIRICERNLEKKSNEMEVMERTYGQKIKDITVSAKLYTGMADTLLISLTWVGRLLVFFWGGGAQCNVDNGN